jgi:hypothetical protein
MKRFAILMLGLAVWAGAARGQTETLLQGPHKVGWAFGTGWGVTGLASDAAVLRHWNFTLVFDSEWTFGWTEHRTYPNQVGAPPGAPEGAGLEMVYQGLEFGRVFRPAKLLHPGVFLLAGWGEPRVVDGRSGRRLDEDYVFVLEPSAFIEVNVTRWMRVAAGAGYRVVGDSDLPGLDDADAAGMTGGLRLRFGKF